VMASPAVGEGSLEDGGVGGAADEDGALRLPAVHRSIQEPETALLRRQPETLNLMLHQYLQVEPIIRLPPLIDCNGFRRHPAKLAKIAPVAILSPSLALISRPRRARLRPAPGRSARRPEEPSFPPPGRGRSLRPPSAERRADRPAPARIGGRGS